MTVVYQPIVYLGRYYTRPLVDALGPRVDGFGRRSVDGDTRTGRNLPYPDCTLVDELVDDRWTKPSTWAVYPSTQKAKLVDGLKTGRMGKQHLRYRLTRAKLLDFDSHNRIISAVEAGAKIQ